MTTALYQRYNTGLTSAAHRCILRASCNRDFAIRLNTEKPTVTWTVQLPESTYEAFVSLLPVNGSFTRVITLGLQEFLAKVEGEPMLQVWVQEEIARHIHLEERSESLHRLEVSIPTDLYQRFNAVVPSWGGTSWFVRRLIAAMSTKDTLSLRSHVADAITKLLSSPYPIER